MPEPLLEVRDLAVEYSRGWRGRHSTRAVDGVSLEIREGESVGLVGESGSGKTSIGAAILGLAPIAAGGVAFDGEDVTAARASRRRQLAAQMQAIFQDPYSSLNPVRTIAQTLAEPLIAQRGIGRAEIHERIGEMLVRVGLDAEAARRYPSQFSGGQRQRIAIARALIVSPRLVVCDEAVSALDLSVQAQVLNLLLELQQELSLSYLFISHDLDVVRHMTDRVIVLYRGRVMEAGESERVCSEPTHPYTRALLMAVPVPHPELQTARRAARLGTREPRRPDASLAAGCPFADRCPLAEARCETEVPALAPGPRGTLVACHFRDRLAAAGAPSGPAANSARPAASARL
jgi:oligopeptide/dipeptide ABC transporter ATP-binding protein